MEKPQDRNIYIQRWQSVKDAKVFSKNDSKGFAKNRFNRSEFKAVAQRTSGILVKQAYDKIQQILTRTNEKGDNIIYGR